MVDVERAVGVRHVVDVEVDGGQHRAQALEERLLGGLAAGGGEEVAVAVDVAAGLEPAAQLAVVQQQGAPAGGDDDGRGRQVVGQRGPVERVSSTVAEGKHPPPHGLETGRQDGGSHLVPGQGAVAGTAGGPLVIGIEHLPVGHIHLLARPARDVGMAGQVPAPRQVCALGQADPGAGGRLDRERRAIAGEGHASVRLDEVGTVEGAVDPEGLAEAGRPRGQVAVAAGLGAGGPDGVEPGDRRRRPAAARRRPRPRGRRRRWRTSACRR